MIKTVFLDMDGVLVDFVSSINKCMGIPENTVALIRNWWEKYDVSFEQINNYCTIDFWQNLTWLSDGKEILSAVLDKFPQSNIFLLTTPMPNSGSWTGKFKWVQKHLPLFTKQLIVTTTPKTLFADPDILLIDDYDKNIEEFIIAGGRGCLVPRSSNKAHLQADRTVEVVKEFLERVC